MWNPTTPHPRMFAGVDTRDDINLGDFLLQPEARAGYRYDFANGQESVTANFIDVTPTDQFKISGPKPSAGNALAGLGVSLATGAWSVGLSVDYLYANSGNTSEEGTVSLIGRIEDSKNYRRGSQMPVATTSELTLR